MGGPDIWHIVKIEEEKEHNKVVEKVIKQLVENSLYIKLEKCKYRIKEVGFLEVVIGLEGIKIEEEKIKDVTIQKS